MEEKTGWLEPNGTFRLCGYTEHISAARNYYNTYDVELLTKQGIIPIFWNPVTNKYDYYSEKCLTDEQINWLINNDIKIYDEDVGII